MVILGGGLLLRAGCWTGWRCRQTKCLLKKMAMEVSVQSLRLKCSLQLSFELSFCYYALLWGTRIWTWKMDMDLGLNLRHTVILCPFLRLVPMELDLHLLGLSLTDVCTGKLTWKYSLPYIPKQVETRTDMHMREQIRFVQIQTCGFEWKCENKYWIEMLMYLQFCGSIWFSALRFWWICWVAEISAQG